MKATKRRRPQVRSLGPAPDGVSLAEVAALVSYVGSPEHKDTPSFAGAPRPRADASICDQSFVGRQDEIIESLRQAIVDGQVSAYWEGGFPRYAWARIDGVCYEARLVNSDQGQYKGYELSDDECPEGI